MSHVEGDTAIADSRRCPVRPPRHRVIPCTHRDSALIITAARGTTAAQTNSALLAILLCSSCNAESNTARTLRECGRKYRKKPKPSVGGRWPSFFRPVLVLVWIPGFQALRRVHTDGVS